MHMAQEEAEVSSLDSEKVRISTHTSSRSRRLHISGGTQGRLWRRLRWRQCLPCSEAGTEF